MPIGDTSPRATNTGTNSPQISTAADLFKAKRLTVQRVLEEIGANGLNRLYERAALDACLIKQRRILKDEYERFKVTWLAEKARTKARGIKEGRTVLAAFADLLGIHPSLAHKYIEGQHPPQPGRLPLLLMKLGREPADVAPDATEIKRSVLKSMTSVIVRALRLNRHVVLTDDDLAIMDRLRTLIRYPDDVCEIDQEAYARWISEQCRPMDVNWESAAAVTVDASLLLQCAIGLRDAFTIAAPWQIAAVLIIADRLSTADVYAHVAKLSDRHEITDRSYAYDEECEPLERLVLDRTWHSIRRYLSWCPQGKTRAKAHVLGWLFNQPREMELEGKPTSKALPTDFALRWAAQLEQVAYSQPSGEDILVVVGKVYFHAGFYEKALCAFDAAIVRAADDRYSWEKEGERPSFDFMQNVLIWRARVLHLCGKTESAVEIFEMLMEKYSYAGSNENIRDEINNWLACHGNAAIRDEKRAYAVIDRFFGWLTNHPAL